MAEPGHLLEAFARSGPAGPFMERALAACTSLADPSFRAWFASVPRRLGDEAKERAEPPPALRSLGAGTLSWTDWVRATLLSRALSGSPEADQPGALLGFFESGEIGEQQSVLRSLPLLLAPGRFVETAIMACRSNARSVFEAVACGNPFPASHFPDLYFNQMVMKAIFIELPVERIDRLGERRNAELTRMLADYASERRAASRPVPADVIHLLEGARS